MISYYGYTISPNQIETGEGFLICRNVPIARTGEQDYLGTELGLPVADVVKVNRPAEEVFSDAALASFEGKPVTNDHPPELIDSETATMYEKGHVQNVRKGEGEWEGYVIGDLHIHDADLIRAIKEGKRQISCGYECDYSEDGDGYKQTNIRGNHVAVVELGRAGSKAAIMDSNITKPKKAERKTTMSKQSTFMKLFGMAANGKNDEELTQLAMDVAPLMDADEPAKEEPAKEESKDEDPVAALAAKVDDLAAKLEALTKPETEDEVTEEVTEELDEAIEKLAPEEEKGGEEATVVPAEEMDACGKDGCKAVSDSAAAHILKAMRPAVAEITDEKVRKSVSDALINAVSVKTDDIAKVMDAQASYQSKSATASLDEVQNAYANMNPHTKKEDK